MSQSPLLLRRLLRAKDRMDAASHEEWPVAAAGARSAASRRRYFARSFKQAFGMPPHRYLLTRRIERATALLRDTDLPITEIAFATGWNSLGTFGRIFRDITGAEPRRAAHARARPPARRASRCPSASCARPSGPTSTPQFRRSAGAAPLVQTGASTQKEVP